MYVKDIGSECILEEYAMDICCAWFDTQLSLLQRNIIFHLYNRSIDCWSRTLDHPEYIKSMPRTFAVHGLTLSYHRCRDTDFITCIIGAWSESQGHWITVHT